MIKRLRVFAGPNGSGKSTFIQQFPLAPNIKLGKYINADDIEASLKLSNTIDLEPYELNLSTEILQSYFRESRFAPVKLKDPDLWQSFTISGSQIVVDRSVSINSYIAADIAEFLRRQLMEKEISFSFETVMSDARKLDFLELAKQKGYKIYLYFFCTKNPKININRVKVRVAQSGHDVDERVVESRYYKSLENLKGAVTISSKAYIFENSQVNELIADVTEGKAINMTDNKDIPDWFIKYLIDA